MNLELTINAGPELIRFAEIIAGGFNRQPQMTVADPVTVTGTTRSRKTTTAPVAETKIEGAATEEKEQPTDTKTLTVEDLRGLCQEKARDGKRAEVKSLLSSFKVEKVTELKEADYSVFAEKIEAL